MNPNQPLQEPPAIAESAHPQAAQFRTLINQAVTGDPAAREKLRQCLDEHQLWARAGDVSERVIEQWILVTAPPNAPEIRKALEAKLLEIWNQLCGEHPSPLEELVVRRIQCCWLQTYNADMLQAASRRAPNVADKTINLLAQRTETCQRGLLKAIRELAILRRLQPRIIEARVIPPASKSRRRRSSRPKATTKAIATTKPKVAEISKPTAQLADDELLRLYQQREHPNEYTLALPAEFLRIDVGVASS